MTSSRTTRAEPEWLPDRLLAGYQIRVIPLDDIEPAVGEPEDAVLVGTLLRRNPPSSRRAVLYLHGWNDYFFQPHLGDFWASLGFDFYALELRRYGRSLAPGQLKGYVTDLDDYSLELDAAYQVLHAEHDQITLMGHSTGGLVASLWADQRPGLLDGLVLNSPWLDLQASPMLRAATAPVLARLSNSRPTQVIPLPNNGFYIRSIDSGQDGEWTLEPEWKNATDFHIRVGWMAAILEGHAKVAAGLAIDTPILSLSSTRTDFRRSWDEALLSSDMVLDVEKISARAVKLGRHVTVVRIDGGMHDLALSAPPVRTAFFDEIGRWVRAYLLAGTPAHL